jgi:4-amino-4-deoxy-L-arabinose transferase-like glycosyltransferase
MNFIKSIDKNNKIRTIIVAIIITVFAIMLIFGAKGDSQTADESVHIASGYLYTYGDHKFNGEHPPLVNYIGGWFVRLLAKPDVSQNHETEQYKYGEFLLYQSGNDADNIIFSARLNIIILCIILAIIIFLWAKELWGFWGGLISLLLFTFCPLILANGRLATTDMGSVFYFVLFIWTIRWFTKKVGIKRALVLGLVIGLSLASKFSNAITLPMAVLLFVILLFAKKINFKQFVGYLSVSVIVSLIVLWLSYFLVMQKQFADYKNQPYLMNHTFLNGKTISNRYAQMILMPVDSYLGGFAFVREHSDKGHMSFLDGEAKIEGWWYYFPKAVYYKTFIPTMILFVLSLFAMIKIRAKNYLEEIYIFLLPITYFAISLTSHLDIGIRHVMIIYPFAYLSIGRLAKLSFSKRWLNILAKTIILGLIIWAIALSIYSYPNDISYFNELAGGSKNGYKHLADSNVDWNQDIKRLKDYMDKNRYNYAYYACDKNTIYNYYKINTRFAGDTSPINNDYLALRTFCYTLPSDEAKNDPVYQKIKNLTPIDMVGNSILIYKISQ